MDCDRVGVTENRKLWVCVLYGCFTVKPTLILGCCPLTPWDLEQMFLSGMFCLPPWVMLALAGPPRLPGDCRKDQSI